MTTLRKNKISPRVKSATMGILFGMLFPLYSSIIELRSLGYPLSLNSFLQVQRSNPLLWVIDTAPLFLGIFAWFAGTRKEKLED
jgi:two-component system aerobic respiration control sensor histidine kinase ArcB